MKILSAVMVLTVIFFIGFSNLGSSNTFVQAQTLPDSLYVDPVYGKKNATGKEDDPFLTIQAAVERASSGDFIYLKRGDYTLNKDIIVSEMAELHIMAYDQDYRPRLLEWGINLQATGGMIVNITIRDIIIESSRALRIMGTVLDLLIENVDFLMSGPATEDVIKFDRVKLGGDGTNPGGSTNGVIFRNCVFDTRDSYSIGISFFSWRLISSTPDFSKSNQLWFDHVVMTGGSRGALMLFFEAVPNLKISDCQFAGLAGIALTTPINTVIDRNNFEGMGILVVGNATTLNITNNRFANFGRDKMPTVDRRISITLSPIAHMPNYYSKVYITGNQFINYTDTGQDSFQGYAAITLAAYAGRLQPLNLHISNNDFSLMSNPDDNWGLLSASPYSPSSELSVSTSADRRRVKTELELYGPFAIVSNWVDKVNISLNYYGSPNGPSDCCNPKTPMDGPRVSANLEWNPYCTSLLCNATTSIELKCSLCVDFTQPDGPPTGIPGEPPSTDAGFIVIMVTLVLAVIGLVTGGTILYCFLRPKSLESYQAIPSDGFRSKLLADVQDLDALFQSVGVPLINFDDIRLNPIPIGRGAFGSVYEGVLSASSPVELQQELRTLSDRENWTIRGTVHTQHNGGSSSNQESFENYSDAMSQMSPSVPTLITTFMGNGANKTPEKPKPKSKSKKSKEKDEPRHIAVKVLNPAITDTYSDMLEFLSEIKIMASIDHPNLLKVRGVAINPDNENIMLVMDLMELGSLDDILFKTKAKMSYTRKLAIATEIGYALHYLHSKEPAICHRDLKPGNVLVSKKWTIKVCDFGSSRVLERKTATLTFTGTPVYMSPEAIKKSKFSEQSDVYSYGVTLVELFGESRAFDDVAGNSMNLMFQIAEGLRPTIPKGIPASLKSLIRRCMASEPESRPSFTDILEKLAEIRAASPSDQTESSETNLINFASSRSTSDLSEPGSPVPLDHSSSSDLL